jgi:hypothetical protein
VKTRLLSPLLLTALALCGAGGVVLAADREVPPHELPESVSRIERETGARVLSAQRSQRGGREMNRIKVLTPQGRVRVMWDDPHHGAALMGAPRAGERSRQPAADAMRRAAERAARDEG